MTDARLSTGTVGPAAHKAAGRVLVALAVAACGLALPSCVVARRIDRAAVDYNVTLASAQNEMLLLNVARASKKHPLLLSAVSQVSHSVETTASLGVDVPFGAGSNDEYGASPSIGISGGPTMDVAPLATQNFMRGFMTPVSPEIFGQYLEGGWPPELLLKVLVREIVDVDGTSYVGRPSADMAEYARYEAKVAQVVKEGIHLDLEREGLGPAVAVDERHPLTLKDLLAATKAGYEIATAGGKARLLGKKEWRLRIGQEHSAEPAADKPAEPGGGTTGDRPGIRLLMRSPEGIVYFLGQIVRIERKIGRPPILVRGKPLFSADPRRRACDSCGVTVTYCDETYAVSGDPDADESMHVLSLLSQVIGLQKSADEMPRSAIVRLVGQ